MKLDYTNGSLVTVAESVTDIQKLIATFGPKTAPRVRNGERNSWKGKHKKECSTCGKKFINLKLHHLIKHGEKWKNGGWGKGKIHV